MIKWEYKVFQTMSVYDDAEKFFNDRGNEGWEYCQQLNHGLRTPRQDFLFRRPIQKVPSISQSCIDTLNLAHNKDDYGAFISLESVREILNYLGLQ